MSYYKKAYSQEFGWVLVPDRQASEELQKFNLNTYYRCKISKPRNAKFHRLIFGNISAVYNNIDWQGSFESFENYIKIKAYAYGSPTATVIRLQNETLIVPVSVAFDSMDQLTFEKCEEGINQVLCDIAGLQDKKELYYIATEEAKND